jgi:tetratricopeptide (TPR) repeat protein
MQPNNEILIDYLDNPLGQPNADQVENMLKKDKSLAGDLQYLKLAIDTVRLDAINEKVFSIRQSLLDTSKVPVKPAGAIIHSMYKISMRVAAIFVLLVGITVLYKYVSVTNVSIYEKQFTGYELSNTRGQEAHENEVEAYRNKNWNEVITIYQSGNNNSNKSAFLAAMSEMQLNHFPQAVTLFENILNTNNNTGDKSFLEESEYYLSLAYLMNHEVNKSVLLLNKIKADTGHTYYPTASKLSAIDMKIIELKK